MSSGANIIRASSRRIYWVAGIHLYAPSTLSTRASVSAGCMSGSVPATPGPPLRTGCTSPAKKSSVTWGKDGPHRLTAIRYRGPYSDTKLQPRVGQTAQYTCWLYSGVHAGNYRTRPLALTDQLGKISVEVDFSCRVLGNRRAVGWGVIPPQSDPGPCSETKLRPRVGQTYRGVHAGDDRTRPLS